MKVYIFSILYLYYYFFSQFKKKNVFLNVQPWDWPFMISKSGFVGQQAAGSEELHNSVTWRLL